MSLSVPTRLLSTGSGMPADRAWGGFAA